MTTGLQHQLVREYLVRLDAALLKLRAAQAAELREQLTAHLDDALAPDANQEDVRAVLTDLGEPVVVVPASSPTSLPQRLRQVRKRRWIALFTVVLVAVGSIAVADQWRHAGSLDCDCASAWADPIDRQAKLDSYADGHRQTTVRIRVNARQGFDIQLTNRTAFTQTILGWGMTGRSSNGWQPNPPRPEVLGSFGATRFTMLFSGDSDGRDEFVPRSIDQDVPVSIRPGGFRTLSVTWPSTALPCVGSGVTTSIDTIPLRVRVGWFTRTEVINLPEAFAITGPSGTCADAP